MMDLNKLRDEIYEDAVAHGLWEEGGWPTECANLIECETDELYEAASEWEDHGWDYECIDERFEEELADVVILCCSVAGHFKIDIDAAVRRKMEINKGRPWKHGKE